MPHSTQKRANVAGTQDDVELKSGSPKQSRMTRSKLGST